MKKILGIVVQILAFTSCISPWFKRRLPWQGSGTPGIHYEKFVSKVNFDQHELKERLSAMSYLVTQEKQVEKKKSGIYYDHWEAGTYKCIVCNEPLLKSEHKYKTRDGHPTFDTALPGLIDQEPPWLYKTKDFWKAKFTKRFRFNSARCGNCGAYLGYLFRCCEKNKTGIRYVIQSAALNFEPSEPKSTNDDQVIDLQQNTTIDPQQVPTIDPQQVPIMDPQQVPTIDPLVNAATVFADVQNIN